MHQIEESRVIDVSEVRAAVLGLGTMGRSIVQLLQSRGVPTRAFDPLSDAARRAADTIPHLELASSIEDVVDGADIVFEAVYEDLDIKRATLDEVSVRSSAVIASNTSTFLPSLLSETVSQPERFLVVHFFNPADLIPLVEVVPHRETSHNIVDDVVGLMTALGKKPVTVLREREGFVANRLQAALLRECLSLVEDGVVTPREIDEVVINGLAPRWAAVGPIGVADRGGLDIFAAVCAQIFPTLDASTKPSPLLMEHVNAGRLGAKTGAGFYEHSSESATEYAAALLRQLALT